jgi:hypothetical protein
MRATILTAACGIATLFGGAARAEVPPRVIELCRANERSGLADDATCAAARTALAEEFCAALEDEGRFPMDVNGDRVIEADRDACIAVVRAPDPFDRPE